MTKRRLSAVPDPVLRDGVYIRVSAVMGRDDDRFLSPDIQRAEIDRARGRGPASTVAAEWRDIDVSTRLDPSKRPGLQAALRAARAGDIDRLWILNLDRFDRDTRALALFDEIAALGVELWTEAGRIDLATPEGYLTTSMQLAIARYQRDRIGKNWKQVLQNRIARGLPHTRGKGKWGYHYDEATQTFTPDPDIAPIITELYHRYNAGESIYALVRWLNAHGYRTVQDGEWRSAALRSFLANGFAAGLIRFNGDTYPGSHPPLIDEATWNAYQANRARRRQHVNTERSQYLLSGLVRCACGARMQAGNHGSKKTPSYRCKRTQDTGAHTGSIVTSAVLEQAVMAFLRDLADDVDHATDLALAVERKQTRRTVDLDRLRQEIARANDRLVKLTLDLTAGVVPQIAYEPARDEIMRQRDGLAERIARAELDALTTPVERPQAAAAALLRDWDALAIPNRREALQALVAEVWVKPGRPRAEIRVIPSWTTG